MSQARQISIQDPDHGEALAGILAKGGIVGSIWAHHLYFLSCNAFDKKAVARMNKIKGRPENQVLVSPGAIEEIEEFVDLKRCKGLSNAAKKMGKSPTEYLNFLFQRFPLGVELYANDKAPSSITYATSSGKTIWIAAYARDRYYTKFLSAVREIRKKGTKVLFAGTSLNLKGQNTLTVKDTDRVVKDFSNLIDAISTHPKSSKLKKLKFSTSCSSVSFINNEPKLLRVGATSINILMKYIPNLEIHSHVAKTRK